MSLYNLLSKTNNYRQFGWDLNPENETTTFQFQVVFGLLGTASDFSKE
jgi:hypothetical protein